MVAVEPSYWDITYDTVKLNPRENLLQCHHSFIGFHIYAPNQVRRTVWLEKRIVVLFAKKKKRL